MKELVRFENDLVELLETSDLERIEQPLRKDLHKNNFIRTKALILTRKSRTS